MKTRRQTTGVQHDAVPWLRLRGPGGSIDHAIYSSGGGWWTTACRVWTPSGVEHREPDRKCRKCVAFLRTATLRQEARP